MAGTLKFAGVALSVQPEENRIALTVRKGVFSFVETGSATEARAVAAALLAAADKAEAVNAQTV